MMLLFLKSGNSDLLFLEFGVWKLETFLCTFAPMITIDHIKELVDRKDALRRHL